MNATYMLHDVTNQRCRIDLISCDGDAVMETNNNMTRLPMVHMTNPIPKEMQTLQTNIKVDTETFRDQNRTSQTRYFKREHEDYQQALKACLEMRVTFSDKHGVRSLEADEVAYMAANDSFGDFHPNDEQKMKRNTNNGQGSVVVLPDGAEIVVDNQFELYAKLLSFNEIRGPAFEKEYLKRYSPIDYITLRSLNANLAAAESQLIKQFSDQAYGEEFISSSRKVVKLRLKQILKRIALPELAIAS